MTGGASTMTAPANTVASPGLQADRRRALVEVFSRHGALADPDLLAELSLESRAAEIAQAFLAGLEEVPFHLDVALWHRLQTARDEAPPMETTATDAQRARKLAMRHNAAAIYDGVPSEEEADEPEGEGAEEPVPSDARQAAKAFRVASRGEWRPLAASHDGRLEIVSDMTGQSTCEGTTEDFTRYFQDRFRQLQKILRTRRELRAATTIERIRGGQQEVQVIGMVVERITARSGNTLLELEDETGTIRALIKKDEAQLHALAETLVQDEVIGVVGQAGAKGDILFVDTLLRPDIPIPDRDDHRGADVPLMAAFLSDIHVGSGTFLSENWKRMLRWLSGEEGSRREREAAGRVKYLVIPGDLVDGVGVYPGQQAELTIPDIYDQYEAFGDWMDSVPGHIEVVVQPGNHDAARPAEPQPAFGQEVRGRFDRHHAKFLSNPATFRMHGVTTLGYHGFSLIDMATSVANLEYEKPLPTMRQLLQSRHLAPIYGERTPVAPEHKDYLVIHDVPDLFVTGHVHVPGIDHYRGVVMVNCGTWQSQT
ncbi:MAG: DNA-directed DNA polymerase II small subunit, partial [Thermoplasmatota archaeon]